MWRLAGDSLDGAGNSSNKSDKLCWFALYKDSSYSSSSSVSFINFDNLGSALPSSDLLEPTASVSKS